MVVDVDGDGIVVHVDRDAHAAEDLPREDPRFILAVLFAEQRTAWADDGDRLGRNGLLRDGKRRGALR
jgi:hypothetical protein